MPPLLSKLSIFTHNEDKWVFADDFIKLLQDNLQPTDEFKSVSGYNLMKELRYHHNGVTEIDGKTVLKLLSVLRYVFRHTDDMIFCKEVAVEVQNKAFSVSSNLKEHMPLHSGERLHTCDECGKSFKRKGSLQYHQITHTGERPYTCEECGNHYAYSNQLRTHMKMHTGESPYTCNECAKCFTHKCNLRIHMRTHTGERPYSCTECKRSFSHKCNLQKHINMSHSAKECEKSRENMSYSNLNAPDVTPAIVNVETTSKVVEDIQGIVVKVEAHSGGVEGHTCTFEEMNNISEHVNTVKVENTEVEPVEEYDTYL